MFLKQDVDNRGHDNNTCLWHDWTCLEGRLPCPPRTWRCCLRKNNRHMKAQESITDLLFKRAGLLYKLRITCCITI